MTEAKTERDDVVQMVNMVNMVTDPAFLDDFAQALVRDAWKWAAGALPSVPEPVPEEIKAAVNALRGEPDNDAAQ